MVQNAGNPQCDCDCLPFERGNFQAKQQISEILAGGKKIYNQTSPSTRSLFCVHTHKASTRQYGVVKKKEASHADFACDACPSLLNHSCKPAEVRCHGLLTSERGRSRKSNNKSRPTHLPLFSFKKNRAKISMTFFFSFFLKEKSCFSRTRMETKQLVRKQKPPPPHSEHHTVCAWELRLCIK